MNIPKWPRRNVARVIPIVYAFIVISPSAALAYFIAVFGVNVVFWDEWDMVPLLERLNQGRLSVMDLFVQHNEHRSLFPMLLALVTDKLTGFNTVVEMFLGWFLLTSAVVLLFSVYWVKSHKDPKVLLFFLPASFLLFSFGQYESILWWVVSIAIYLVIFEVVATFTLLEGGLKSTRSFTLALVAAIVASFSFVNGLLVWPVGLFQILMRDRRKNGRRALIWIITWLIVSGVYFYGWASQQAVEEPSWSYAFEHPFEAIMYLLSLVGEPLSVGLNTAPVFGLTVILISAVVLGQAWRMKMLKTGGAFLSLTLFGALSSLATTIGRAGWGVQEAVASRYTPFTSLGIVGLYLLAIAVAQKAPGKDQKRDATAKSGGLIAMNHRAGGVHALLAIFLIGLIVSYGGGWQGGEYLLSRMETGAYVLKTYQIQSDENIQTYLLPDAAKVRERAPYLQQNGLNVFGEPTIVTSSLTSIGSDTYFSLDTINGQIVSQTASPIIIHSDQAGTITITGWAVDKQANSTARAVFITIDGNLDVPTLYGGDRPDVAAALGNPHFEYSGYIATFSSLILSKGEHTISLKIVTLNGPYFYYEQNVAYFVLSR